MAFDRSDIPDRPDVDGVPVSPVPKIEPHDVLARLDRLEHEASLLRRGMEKMLNELHPPVAPPHEHPEVN